MTRGPRPVSGSWSGISQRVAPPDGNTGRCPIQGGSPQLATARLAQNAATRIDHSITATTGADGRADACRQRAETTTFRSGGFGVVGDDNARSRGGTVLAWDVSM